MNVIKDYFIYMPFRKSYILSLIALLFSLALNHKQFINTFAYKVSLGYLPHGKECIGRNNHCEGK